MANTKNPFGRLYEVKSAAQWATYKVLGNLAFGHWTTDTNENVYKIWANNVEYDVVDATAYKALYEHVHNTVDPSINTIETWKKALKLAVADTDNKISITGIDGEVSIKGSDYVAVSTTGSEIAVSIDDEKVQAGADHATEDDEKLATVGYVKDVQDGALKEAKISTAVDASKATVTLTTKNGKGVESTTTYTVKGDSFITIAAGDDSSIAVKISATADENDIANATANAKVATDYAVKKYVADQISALESALELKGSIASNEDAAAKLTTAAASKGDTYVVTGACEYAEEKLENGDLVIVKADSAAGHASEIIVVERNLDGAVTADAELSADKVVLGAGAQGVKTSELALGSDNDTSVAEKTLATEKFVEKLANAAGGELAGHKSDGVVTVDLTSNETGATQGNLGSVVVKGAENGYVSVDFAAGEGIKLSTDIVEIEGITSTSTNGLATALNVSTAIHSAIEALDANDTAVSGQVVVAVSETDGIVSPTRLGVKVNGKAFITEEGEGESKVSVLSATIDGTDILVGGNSTTYKDKSIAVAIDELSQVVSAGITGETALNPQQGTAANDDFVAVSVIKPTNGTPYIDSSVLVATAIADSSTVYTNATGLATDAYVKDYVAYELAWEVISDDTNTENA